MEFGWKPEIGVILRRCVILTIKVGLQKIAIFELSSSDLARLHQYKDINFLL